MTATGSSEVAPPASAPFWREALLIFLGVLLLSLPQAALLPLLDRDEPRFAEASREMLQSGHYIVPTFNHAPRYAKPPLIYWCQVLCYRILGENAFAARFPSLLATAGTALLLFLWGARLGSKQMGLGAALSYAFCLQTIQQGRVATADALLIFFMTLTAYMGWKLLRHEPPPQDQSAPRPVFRSDSTPRAWTLWLVVALTAGFLAKGPEAWLPVAVLLICARTWGARVFFFGGFLASLALVCLWAVPAYIATHGDYWKVGLGHDVLDRMDGGNFQGHGASSFGWYLLGVPLYLLLFWLSALPWSPLLVTHRKRLFGGWQTDKTDVYLLLNAGIVFLVFSLMVTKLPHYTLPAFPFLALLFARRWKSAGFSPGYITELGWVAGIGLAIVAAGGIPLALAAKMTPSPVGELVRAAHDTLTPATEFALVDFQEPNTIWEMRRVVNGYGEVIPEGSVLSYLGQPGPRAVILSTALWQKISTASNEAHPSWKIYEARGFNAAKLKWIDLTLVVNGG